MQVLKQARLLNPRGEGRPFIAALSGDILGAGAFYEAQQKLEHAAHLFTSFGMWDAASETLKLAASSQSWGERSSLRKVKVALADAWKEQGNWKQAIDIYSSLKHQMGLLEAYFHSGRYEELEGLARELPEVDTELLLRAAQLLAAAGRGAASADAFLRARKPEFAVDAAMFGGEWAQAISIARQHCNSTKLQAVTSGYKNAMQHHHRKCSNADIVEAFLTLGAFEAAAQELGGLPRHQGHLPQNPRRQRKMHIIAALLARKHHYKSGFKNENILVTPSMKIACSASSEKYDFSRKARSISAYSLSAEEEYHWQSATAYHLYLLCCFHLSEQRVRAALCTAVRLWECYERQLSLYLSAHLLFISAYKSKEWDLCSQALHVMQMDAKVSPGGKQSLEATKRLVFSSREMQEAPWTPQLPCPNCNALSSYWECFCPSCDFSFPWCAATGLPIRYVRCIMEHNSAKEAGDNRYSPSPVPAAGASSSPGDPDSFWPYGGPGDPEACGLCGLLTAAWGPEGPQSSCPLCSQPFSCQPEDGKQLQVPPQSLTSEDRGWSGILKVSPEDIFLQAGRLI